MRRVRWKFINQPKTHNMNWPLYYLIEMWGSSSLGAPLERIYYVKY